MKKFFLISIVVFLSVLSACSTTTTYVDCEYVLAERVVDGDTFVIEGGERVRLLGIDTPETVHPEKEVEYFGKEASDELTRLIEGKQVCMKRDVNKIIDYDKYGRMLRYIYVDHLFVNEYLVKEGYAFVYRKSPHQYLENFDALEVEARNQQKGLWNADSASQFETQESVPYVCEGEEGVICAEEAKNYVGKTVSVRMKVESSHNSGKAAFLNTKKNHKDADNFAVVIFAHDFENFAGDPAEMYLNQEITITGKIQEYEGQIEMILSYPPK